jgi:hypothetical protein
LNLIIKQNPMSNKYIQFYNNTDLPIMLDSWIDGSNRLHTIKINQREKRIIHSSVGEWHIHSMFEHSSEERQIWREKGFEKYTNIGQFRSSPCASGNYSWLDYDIFECTFSETESFENGLISFSYKTLGPAVKNQCIQKIHMYNISK